MKLCPRCSLPIRLMGRVYAATSGDGATHGVVGICHRCILSEKGLPKSTHLRRLQPALERALGDPAPYYAAIFRDPGAAVLAVALLGHRDLSTRALVALGWIDTTNPERDCANSR